jgi:dihydropteroate synthase
LVGEGAAIVDIGGASTRPGATEVSEKEELDRVLPAVEEFMRAFPHVLVSVDTYRSQVAARCLEAGAHIINDISGGRYDPDMFQLVAKTGAPYVMMHIQGTPRSMQKNPTYGNVVAEVTAFFRGQLDKLRALGVRDNVIIDPGFGFGKTVDHNFQLLDALGTFATLGCPVMAGVSRKSMINRVLGTTAKEALNGTTVINTIALLGGADILRVHDVREAIEAVQLVRKLKSIKQK